MNGTPKDLSELVDQLRMTPVNSPEQMRLVIRDYLSQKVGAAILEHDNPSVVVALGDLWTELTGETIKGSE